MRMHYDIEADWLLLTTCNFRCSYCFFAPHELGARVQRHGTPAQWEAGFNSTDKVWLIHISGGEPSVHPDFLDLVERLSSRHYLSLNSNLAHRSIDELPSRIDPARVFFINAALHPQQRRERGSLDGFVERARRLSSAGFRVLVSVLMTPAAVRALPQVASHLRAQGISPIPKVLRGHFQGRRYPNAYTPDEKAVIREYVARARHDYAAMMATLGEAPTIDVLSDDRFVDGKPNYWGRACEAGRRFVRIDPDGTVRRCGLKQPLGNLLARKLELLPKPMPCNTFYCPYFCEKYSTRIVERRAGDDESLAALPWS